MRARINSTGRKRIRRDMVTFNIDKVGGNKFSASIDLSSLDLPPAASIVVEAYRQSISERFSYGTVGDPNSMDAAYLRYLDPTEVAFRVKVIDSNSGQVLARGDAFQSSDGENFGRRPLLKLVISNSLENQPWLVTRGDTGMQLVLNARIEEAEKRIKADKIYRALVLPAALRMVLMILWSEGAEYVEEDDDDDEDYLWFRFAESLGCPPPSSLKDNEDETKDWIDQVCNAFCRNEDFAGMLTSEEPL